MNDTLPERLRRSEAATYLKRRYGFGTASYLGRLASLELGPTYERIGHLCLYRPADLDHWALNRPDGRITRTAKPAADAVVIPNEGGGE